MFEGEVFDVMTAFVECACVHASVYVLLALGTWRPGMLSVLQYV